MDTILDLLIRGSTLAGVVFGVFDAIKALKSKSKSSNDEVYKENQVDFEKQIVVLNVLPKYEEEKIENFIGYFLSGAIIIISVILQLINGDAVQLPLFDRVTFIILIGGLIGVVLRFMQIIISFVIIKIVNIYASKKGLIRKLPEVFLTKDK